jgi:hypothetical protein
MPKAIETLWSLNALLLLSLDRQMFDMAFVLSAVLVVLPFRCARRGCGAIYRTRPLTLRILKAAFSKF